MTIKNRPQNKLLRDWENDVDLSEGRLSQYKGFKDTTGDVPLHQLPKIESAKRQGELQRARTSRGGEREAKGGDRPGKL